MRVYALVLMIIGLALLIGGACLLSLHGSPYYARSGGALCASAVLMWWHRGEGALLLGLLLCATIAWAAWEVGFRGWELWPRIGLLGLLGDFVFVSPFWRHLQWLRPIRSRIMLLITVLVSVALGAALRVIAPPRIPADPLYQVRTIYADSSIVPTTRKMLPAEGDWRSYGNDTAGSRFSPLTQITPQNVAQLTLAWSFRIGGIQEATLPALEVTPIKIGQSLYLCSGTNDIIALDAESGRERWRYRAHTDSR